MTKVLITGSAGFIAPHVVEECLNRGWEVTCIDIKEEKNKKNNVNYIVKDLRLLKDNEITNVDYVVHLAFVTNIPNSIKNPIETTRDNIEMTTILMDIAQRNNIKKFIFPSTASLFGNNPIPWKESMPADPIEPYSWQKLSCEFLCKMWTIRYGLPTCSFRLFQVFGENQRSDTAMAAFFRSRLEGKPLTLTETTAQSSFRTGRRDFIYVKDVAKAFVEAMLSNKTGKGEIINIGSGKMTSMEEIANAIGGEIKFISKRNFEVECHQADITLALKLLNNWKPTVDVIPWLKKFVENNLKENL